MKSHSTWQTRPWAGESHAMQVAVFTAFGLALHLIEGAVLPRALPFRIGLANLATLLALRTFGFKAAIQVSFWRALLGSIVFGTFLQIISGISLTGAMSGTLGMWLIHRLGRAQVSVLGVSLFGALCSVGGQFAFVSAFLGQEMFFLLPIFLILGLIGGVANGLLALFILEGR